MARGSTTDAILYGDFPRTPVVTKSKLFTTLWDFPVSQRRPLDDYGNVAFAWMNAIHDMYGREESLERDESDKIERLAEGHINGKLIVINRVIINHIFDPELDYLVWSAEKGDANISQARVTQYPKALDQKDLVLGCSLGTLRITPDNQATLNDVTVESLFS